MNDDATIDMINQMVASLKLAQQHEARLDVLEAELAAVRRILATCEKSQQTQNQNTESKTR